jgi:hypothetical protein
LFGGAVDRDYRHELCRLREDPVAASRTE